MKETCRKAIAVALCSIMSFGVVSTVMMEPASAASLHSIGRSDRDKGLERMTAQQKKEKELREKQRKEEENRREKERRERERYEKERKSSSKGHSQGEVNTAAIVGAVIGAVVAKNT